MSKDNEIKRLRCMIEYIHSIENIDQREKYKDLLIYFCWKLNYLVMDDDDFLQWLIDDNIFDLEQEISVLTFVT